MWINNTESLSLTEKIYSRAIVDMSKKKSIGARALANLNNETKGELTDTQPKFYNSIYKDITFIWIAVVPLWTLNGVDGWDFPTTNWLHSIKWDILEYEENGYEVIEAKESVLTLKLIYWNDVELPSGAILKLISNANDEWSDFTVEDRKMQGEEMSYNYTQIVKWVGKITGSAASRIWKTEKDLVLKLDKEAANDFIKKLQGVVLSKYRDKKVTVNDKWAKVIKRYAWGILYFTRNTFNPETWELIWARTDNVIAVNGAATVSHINQCFVKAIDNGWTINTIAGTAGAIASLAPLEEQKVQIINSDGSNAKVVWGGIQKFNSPIEVDGNRITHFEITNELPTGLVLVYNSNAVSLEQLKGRATVSFYRPGQAYWDNFAVEIFDEVTIAIKEATQSFYYLTWVSEV